MKNYIFVTEEGYTKSPDSTYPDIDNLQVLGFGKGEDFEEAKADFLKDCEYLEETSFDEVIAFELKYIDYWRYAMRFSMKD